VLCGGIEGWDGGVLKVERDGGPSRLLPGVIEACVVEIHDLGWRRDERWRER